MNIVQVGLGSFGKKWMKVVHEDDKSNYSGIATRNQETLKQCGNDIGIPKAAQFSSLENMPLGTKDADAVLITTPYFLHKEQILLSLDYEKHILVEYVFSSMIFYVKIRP